LSAAFLYLVLEEIGIITRSFEEDYSFCEGQHVLGIVIVLQRINEGIQNSP